MTSLTLASKCASQQVSRAFGDVDFKLASMPRVERRLQRTGCVTVQQMLDKAAAEKARAEAGLGPVDADRLGSAAGGGGGGGGGYGNRIASGVGGRGVGGGGKAAGELPTVSSLPEVRITALRHTDRVVILATDGLWDVVSSEEAVAMVQRERSASAKQQQQQQQQQQQAGAGGGGGRGGAGQGGGEDGTRGVRAAAESLTREAERRAREMSFRCDNVTAVVLALDLAQ